MRLKYEQYRLCLNELHNLLIAYNESHWANYFTKSICLLNEGKPHKSMLHCLRAYGGMGSFNDQLNFTGAKPETVTRGFELRTELWQLCHNIYNWLKRMFEW